MAVSSMSTQSFIARITSSRRTRSRFASSSSKMKSYFGSAIIARNCVNTAAGAVPTLSSACTLIRLFSSTMFAWKLPSKPPKAWATARFSRGGASGTGVSRSGNRSPATSPESSAPKALESMGSTCQRRMPRLFIACGVDPRGCPAVVDPLGAPGGGPAMLPRTWPPS